MIVAEPAARLPWTAFFISAAMAGASWVVAGSLQAAASAVSAPAVEPIASRA
jgi:hypothetical protein